MTDKYQAIGEALEMGPTPGPWEISRSSGGGFIKEIGPIEADEYAGSAWLEVKESDANFVAACDPDTIMALLAERDALHEALQALYDAQNGPPLERYREEWEAAMAKSAEVLK